MVVSNRLAGTGIAAALAVGIGVATTAAAEFRVNTDRGAAYQGYSACATSADGSFAVVWEDGRAGGNDIYIQRFDPAGERRGGNTPVNSVIAPEQFAPAVATDADGTYWVVWQDFRASGYPINGDVMLQRISPDGVFLNSNILVNDDGAVLTQKEPSIAVGAGGVLVVWIDIRRGEWDVYGQRFDADGKRVGENILLNDEVESAPQHASSVCALPDGRFVVVWYDTRGGNEDVYAQIVSGSRLDGANFRVNAGADGKRQWFPTVSPGPADGFTVCWEDYRSGVYPDGSRIYAQAYDRDGVAIDSNYQVSPGGYDQRKPRLTGDVAGNRAVAWEENRDGRWRIYQRKFLTGVAAGLAASEVGNDSASGSRARPQVAIGAGTVFYTWTDSRSGDFDIYMQLESYRFPTFLPSPRAMSFTAPLRAPESASPVTITVTGIGGAALSIGWRGLPAWLSVSPGSALTPSEYVFKPIAPLSRSDTVVTIYAVDMVDTTAVEPVLVSLNIVVPVLTAMPAAVDFLYADSVETTWVEVINGVAGPLDWDFVSPGGAWEVARAGDSLVVTFNAVGQPDSIWFDTIWVSDSLAQNSPLAIPLRAEVGGIPPSSAYLIVSPSIASWTATWGSVAADSVVVVIGTNKDTAIAWSVDSVPAWLNVSPLSGIVPDTVVFRAASDTLSIGRYSDTLMIWSPDASNAPLALPVELIVDVNSGVGMDPVIRPADAGLAVYPNPFTGSVLVEPERSDRGDPIVSVEVFDLLGRRVADVGSGGVLRVGKNAFRWSPSGVVSSGLYFIRAATPGARFVRRVIYLK